MSNLLLWKYYFEDDVEKFRRLLANANYQLQHSSKNHGGGASYSNSFGSIAGSPGGASPKTVMKGRKVSGSGNASGTKGSNTALGRAEVNSRDHAGLTLLHRVASSTSPSAISFALALIEHPAIDLYVQDRENGWTALHRALYFGNITIARAILERDRWDPNGPGGSTTTRVGSSVIKVKDHEGNSAFDVYNATIARRSLQHIREYTESEEGSMGDTESTPEVIKTGGNLMHGSVDGDELFVFGSNKNHSLGFGDGDDRQFPERITVKRPDHLLFRFYREYLEAQQDLGEVPKGAPKPIPKSLADIPALILNRPVVIQDVTLSKLHSAILTTDPESNLYTCGVGPGGRLGTGDEVTRFTYTCIEDGGLAGKKVATVALGQNHTLAVSSDGEIFSWGTSTYSQLGYSLPRPALKDEEPVCATPRQIFGSLKREVIIGVAASAIHSVAHTSTSLFCWGKNEGQLGLMDSDSRSLSVQTVPRKVAASLFKAPITMVSAINGATICLLANHSVCVFSNYGYTFVKFPLHEEISNYHLNIAALTTRYEATSNHISHITAGGDTIAAVSSRGDLFILNVRRIDPDVPSSSTTNPSKIKSALSSPERVWSLRKGHWDGIKSVGIAENGSLIVCTQAGAVWRRIKRAKIKDAFTGIINYNKKTDFKFQRVPGLTKVAVVRSTTFGVYAAIRKDCDVTRSQIMVEKQKLWQDLNPLLSIREIVTSEPSEEEEEIAAPRFWSPALPKDLFDPLKRAILSSPDIEADVERQLATKDLGSYDVEVCTTNSDVRIPVHGFMLAARSSILRDALNEFRRIGESSIPELCAIKPTSHPQTLASRSPVQITFQGLDFIAILNLVIYVYTDTIIDVWHFTRQRPNMAFRYRQVRVELMKTAAQLKMGKLEHAVRLMIEPDRQMNSDIDSALRDPRFYEDGDTLLELNGSEIPVHSALMCQRCPFFDGLFNGRAGGQWLAGRRQQNPEIIRVDLKHIDPATFDLVLRHIYADVGTELFDNILSVDIDEFSELVMDVMGVANELMLDRLSQICQEVLGRFVNTRNVSQLLNVVAPCSVTKFKDAALEYICLQLESMLENHLIDDLEEDLILELDEVVRANQLSCLPFAKSGRAELLLHERHPSLAGDIDEERRRRLRDMTFRVNLHNDENRLSSSFRARVGSLDDLMSASPSQEKARRKSKAGRNAPFSPSIRPKDSTMDLMFDMDDEDPLTPESLGSPEMKPTVVLIATSRTPSATWNEPELRENEPSSLRSRPTGLGSKSLNATPPSAPNTKTWSSPALPPSKLDFREIMTQDSSSKSRVSSLSMSISAQKTTDEKANKSSTPKLSQKERKKQQQQALKQGLGQPQITVDKPDTKPLSPWQVPISGPKTSLKDVLGESQASPLALSPISSRPSTTRRTASPDTRFPGQQRHTPTSQQPTHQTQASKSSPVVPHSKSYTAPAVKAESSLQLSMADIIGQQRREQEVIKEAVAKRSLQEIQEEQAFQEWWDQESRRAQVEEAARSKPNSSGTDKGGKSGGGRGKGGLRGRGRGRGDPTRVGSRGRTQEK